MGYRVQQSWVRMFRILRVVRLITYVPPLHELFRTFVYAHAAIARPSTGHALTWCIVVCLFVSVVALGV